MAGLGVGLVEVVLEVVSEAVELEEATLEVVECVCEGVELEVEREEEE